jgi:rhodanese-related sulfurtransferase
MKKLLILLLLPLGCFSSPIYKTISIDEAYGIFTEKKAVFIDVRTAQEYDAGHIPGAVLIDVNSDAFDEMIQKLDKNTVYVVYCRSGMRSAKASEKMNSIGIKNVYNVSGGFNDWQEKYPFDK